MQVVQDFQCIPRHLLVVVILGMGFGHAPQLTATVVMVDDGCLPGIFVDEEVTLGVDMTLTRLQGCHHMPDPAQLVTRQVLVDMAGLDDVGVLESRRIDLVAVGGNVHFLLAFERPVITIRCPVVHVQVVGCAQAIRGCAGPS